MKRIIERQELEKLAESLRHDGKRIVTTNGCFDVLHVGHVRILQAAKECGDVLIVGINSDDSVKRLNKGPNRPVNTEADRAEILANLKSVDYVTVFGEDTPVEFLTLIRPNVHVKGADYSPSQLAETPVVESFGGEVKILALVPGKSTTSTIARMRS